MSNYLSAIKSKLPILGLDVAGFADVRLKYYQKAIQMHAPIRVHLKKVIDIPLLRLIVRQCDYTFMGQIYKALYLLSFYSFLRLSNLVPHAVSQYSPLKHLSGGDIILRPGKAIILDKWSKTMQTNDQVKLITVPRIPGSTLCPVSALSNLLSFIPKGANLPLFQIKVAQEWVPLTDSRVRRHFDSILARLQLKNTGYTHTLSGVQVPHLHLITTLPYRIFRGMVPGPRTVCGGISLTQLTLVSRWPICLGISSLLPNTTLFWDLGAKVF